MSTIPAEIHGQKYVSLTTLRKNGAPVATPVWFAELDNRLYVMTRSDSGKCKRIRNNPRAKVAACTIRGKITGPEFDARVRILDPSLGFAARQAIRTKYWLARVPFLWRNTDAYLEIEML
jgi:PPOX class probable F420-dependent enzyme